MEENMFISVVECKRLYDAGIILKTGYFWENLSKISTIGSIPALTIENLWKALPAGISLLKDKNNTTIWRSAGTSDMYTLTKVTKENDDFVSMIVDMLISLEKDKFSCPKDCFSIKIYSYSGKKTLYKRKGPITYDDLIINTIQKMRKIGDRLIGYHEKSEFTMLYFKKNNPTK